jgi:hypothetical protein
MVRTQQEGEHFRVYYQHHYPNGKVEENRRTFLANCSASSNELKRRGSRTNRIFRGLYAENTEGMD